MGPAQQDAIRRNRKLKEAGITTGKRQVYWVGYEQNGEPCREYYLSAKQAFERAMELGTLPATPLARQAVLQVRRGDTNA